MGTDIQRINSYTDRRFSEEILKQHGAFLINKSLPCEVEIINSFEAIIHGDVQEYYDAVMEEFRFYAEHICRFYNENNELIKEFEPVKIFRVKIADIQPSQFCVDRDKIDAVKSFITCLEDIIIPLAKQEKYISLDGHTRLAAATELGYEEVQGFCTKAGDYICAFAKEAKKRGVHTPYDMKRLSHQEYEQEWYGFCDAFFGR